LTEREVEILEALKNEGFILGMMFRDEHPSDFVVYKANIITKETGKIWFGDLNLTQDGKALKGLAKRLKTTFYVLSESDGRYGRENRSMEKLISKALWSTENENT